MERTSDTLYVYGTKVVTEWQLARMLKRRLWLALGAVLAACYAIL